MTEVVLGTRQVSVIVEFDPEGNPTAVRWPCRNPLCCEKRAGLVSLHRRMFVGPPDMVGPIEQRYEARRRAADLVAGADRGRPR